MFPQLLEERAPWVAAVEEAKASKAEEAREAFPTPHGGMPSSELPMGEGKAIAGEEAREGFPERLREVELAASASEKRKAGKEMGSFAVPHKANEDQEASAGAVIQKELKMKRRRRTKKEVHGSAIADVPLELYDLLTKMFALKNSIEDLTKTEQFLECKQKHFEVIACMQQIQAYQVCPCCFMELPSEFCRNVGCESWRYKDLKIVCSHCGQKAVYDGSKEHWEFVRKSLKHRVRAECELAQKAHWEHVQKSLKQKDRAECELVQAASNLNHDDRVTHKLAKDLRTMFKKIDYRLWRWRGTKK